MPWEFDADPTDGLTADDPLRGNPAARRPALRTWYPPVRAAAEFVAALALLVLTTPVMAVAAAVVRLTSPGRAFYAQTRVGRGGRVYTMYKIRSMYQDCEKQSGPCWASKGDPRVTPVGRVLRATHIDELPQLINVLRGEMSLIGPRPERPEFVAKLKRAVPRYGERLRVRPGVTGFAQVQLAADTDLDSVRRKIIYDLYYIDAVNPWLDVCIILCTVLKMVGIPFHLLRWLFGMPTAAEVEQAVRVTAARPAAAVPEPQPA
ncbi:MAG TPA: sugar transferase [Gemmataceae bacterium]|jgi:lipopolysaccharide/colanic/teichoic acid biosynthesis glycosyltransferase